MGRKESNQTNKNYVTLLDCISVPFNRTSISQRSYIPSSIRLWNSLEDDLKNLSTLQTFKKHITSSFNNSCVPSHFTIGNRYISILHARLRNNCSNLNNDLFRNHLRDNPLCDLCGMIEDAIHYFFHCRKFTMERQVFNDTVRVFQPLSIDMILCGNFNLNMENNVVLFRAVHRYIHATKRFKTSWLFVWSFPWNIFCILISILMTNLFYSQVEGVPGSRTIFVSFFLFFSSFNYPIFITYLFIYLLFWCSNFSSFIYIHLHLFIYFLIFFLFFIFLFIYLLFIDYFLYIYLLIYFLFIYLFIYLFTYLFILI